MCVISVQCDANAYNTIKIEKNYCETLEEFGVEKWGKWCFGLYFISWGNLVQLYVDDGEFDKKALDVLNRLPAYYRDNIPPEIEALKKQKLQLKDEIYKILEDNKNK